MFDTLIPKMGMSTVEVDVMEWFVEVGEHVESGTPLLEVESEKSTLTITAEVAGTVKEIVVAEGESANVGDVVCRIEPD